MKGSITPIVYVFPLIKWTAFIFLRSLILQQHLEHAYAFLLLRKGDYSGHETVDIDTPAVLAICFILAICITSFPYYKGKIIRKKILT